MNVGQLIKQLQKYPEDVRVYILDPKVFDGQLQLYDKELESKDVRYESNFYGAYVGILADWGI